MDKKFNGLPQDDKGIVYVRPVQVDTLPDEVRDQLGDLTVVYSVHRANGMTLALVADRKLASLPLPWGCRSPPWRVM